MNTENSNKYFDWFEFSITTLLQLEIKKLALTS